MCDPIFFQIEGVWVQINAIKGLVYVQRIGNGGWSFEIKSILHSFFLQELHFFIVNSLDLILDEIIQNWSQVFLHIWRWLSDFVDIELFPILFVAEFIHKKFLKIMLFTRLHRFISAFWCTLFFVWSKHTLSVIELFLPRLLHGESSI